jgi:uncharacterized membrane-anchored protein YhcB (DUF1043 family)
MSKTSPRSGVEKEVPMKRTMVMVTIALVVGIAVGMIGNQLRD